MYVTHFFQLPEGFKAENRGREPKWGYGEYSKFVFYRTYSRNDNGVQESFAECLLRCIEGCMSIRKDWYIKHKVHWDNTAWTKLAMEMWESAFAMRWLPPGRGLWLMGTKFIYERGSMGLNNCGAVKLRNSSDFGWMLDALMLGVGVGFDPVDEPWTVHNNIGEEDFIIEDCRESWVESFERKVEFYTVPGTKRPRFVYDKIRPEGEPIKGFGGIASGPEYLMKLHGQVDEYFNSDDKSVVLLKANLANAIGCCVVAGNVRRSAELMKGSIRNPIFLGLKDYNKYPQRAEIGGMSNNTCFMAESEDFDHISDTVPGIQVRGEPGFANLINFKYGRLGFKAEYFGDRADLLNPCGESTLEHLELCNQAETMPTMCENEEQIYQAMYHATIYASTVSLLPTHSVRSNAVIARNRRITISMMDYVALKKKYHLHSIIKWLRKGYDTVRATNNWCNDEAGVPRAIKVTTIKPGGTTPKLPGLIPGIGYPTFNYTLRRTRVGQNTNIFKLLHDAGIPHEPDVVSANTEVFEYPIMQGDYPVPSVWEQLTNLILFQREWADNAVSNTLYFKPKWEYHAKHTTLNQVWNHDTYFDSFNEYLDLKQAFELDGLTEHIVEINGQSKWKFLLSRGEWIEVHRYNPDHEEDILENVISFGIAHTKSMSLLPHSVKGAYPQMPEEGLTKEEYEYRLKQIKPIDWSKLNEMSIGTHFCDTEACLTKLP